MAGCPYEAVWIPHALDYNCEILFHLAGLELSYHLFCWPQTTGNGYVWKTCCFYIAPLWRKICALVQWFMMSNWS